METTYVACYWHDRLGQWIGFYVSKDKEDCEKMADMQRSMGDKVKVEERKVGRKKCRRW